MIKQTKSVSGSGKQLAPSYQLQVLLNGAQPGICRRLTAPGTANLGWFHAVLQVAMGWTNSHLHQFICGERVYADSDAQLDSYPGDPPVLDERKATLSEVLGDTHEGLIYVYDFGDSWEHIVTVEKILPADAPASRSAVCLGGSRACPPEDCGGIWGYRELLKAIKNKKHPEHRSMRQWVGDRFDPEIFDTASTNDWLQKLKWPHVTDGQLRKILMARDGYQE